METQPRIFTPLDHPSLQVTGSGSTFLSPFNQTCDSRVSPILRIGAMRDLWGMGIQQKNGAINILKYTAQCTGCSNIFPTQISTDLSLSPPELGIFKGIETRKEHDAYWQQLVIYAWEFILRLSKVPARTPVAVGTRLQSTESAKILCVCKR